MEEKQEIITPVEEMTAGEMLRNARTTGRRKREIATIAKLLCIREDFLTALEEGNYHVIPEVVYILGFARSYAVELGLDPDEVISKLKHELGLIQEEEKEAEKENVFESPKHQIKIDKEKILKFYQTALGYVKKHWIWFASGFVALLLVIVLSIIFIGNGNTEDVKPVEPSAETTQVVSETTEPSEEIKKEPDFRYPVREKFDEKNKKDARVVLQAEKEGWVKVEDARGGSVFSRVLLPGDVYYLPNNDNLKGTFGNVGGVDVWVDGQLINKLGPANTRKSGISMSPNALKAAGVAE